MKLILFDIDGTLVQTGGAGMRAMDRAFSHLYGIDRALQGISLAGRTDRVIISDALAAIEPARTIDEPWLDQFRDIYCELLEQEMSDGAATGKRELPGVRPLLEALASRDDVVLALLTGNFARSARIKLAHFDLWRFFACGAFGDAHADRNLLFGVAQAVACDHGAASVPPERTYVIGDTPHDVACARFGNGRAIAVATGMHSVDELRQSGADVVFSDLSDTAAVLASLDCGLSTGH